MPEKLFTEDEVYAKIGFLVMLLDKSHEANAALVERNEMLNDLLNHCTESTTEDPSSGDDEGNEDPSADSDSA